MTDMQNQPEDEVTVVAKESTQQSAVLNGNINDTATTAVAAEKEEELTTETTTTPLSTSAVLIKTPRADSKLILQNMEEVLKSVKKKHRAKHKRKRELKKLALLEAAAAATTAAAASAEEEEDAANKVLDTGMRKRHYKKPLQLASLENAAATSTHNSILQHFARTPKKQQQTQDRLTDKHKLKNDTNNESIAAAEVDVEIEATPKRKTNAFEVMMNARNKSIGGNSPGKDASLGSEENFNSTALNTPGRNAAQLKCKEILQSWAERKGAGKRRIEEDARAAYVEQQLENRAKRLKRMLIRSSTPTSTEEVAETKGKRRTRAQNVTPQQEQTEDNENSVIEIVEPSKTRKTKKNSTPVTTNTTATPTPTVTIVDDEAAQIHIRPKRSCVTRKSYSLVEQEETTKTRSAKNRAAKFENSPTTIETTEIDLIEIVNLDKSTPKRLAPLFTRGHKPLLDPQQVQARRNFLHSGIPEKLLLEQMRQKEYQQNYIDSFQLFPTVSHIKQLSVSELEQQTTQKRENLIKLIATAPAETDLQSIKIKTQKFGLLLTDCNAKGLHKVKNEPQTSSLKLAQCRCNIPLSNIPGKRLVAKAWKLTHERFPTFKCYNQLREKYRFFSALDTAQDVQQVSESLVVTRLTKHANNNNINNNNNNNDNSNEEFSQPPAAAPNGELLFTEKYKPLLFEQILVNLTPVMQLREFLSNFCQKRCNGNANSDSDLDEDHDSNSNAANMPQNGNTVVLLGPCASGKTNAVFALANEFNFNVLEINAGMKRTGKRLLQELHEATQSHQIRKGASGKRNSLNGRRKSRQQECNAEQLDSARRSLILIEDADIAFEQTDAGFVDAIYTLASVSKRPVIIVATNPNCAHLQRLIQQHTIKFALPHAVSISRYMSLLSLIENCPVSIDDIVSLYLYNGMDMRRTLLELQLFVQSGGDLNRLLTSDTCSFTASPTKQHMCADQASGAQQENATEGKRLGVVDEVMQSTEQIVKNLYVHRSLFDFYTVDQNAVQKIPYPVDFDLLSNNLNELLQKSTIFMKRLSPKKAWLSTSQGMNRSGKHKQQNTLCDFFEQLSAAVMIDAQDQSRSLLNSEYSALAPRRLSADLTHTLVERAIEINLCPEPMPYNLFQTKKMSKNNLSEYLNITPLRGSRACALDWDPIMRNICRYEQQRATDERRSMRFYHYLRGSCASAVNNFSTNHFDHACNLFQDDFNDDKEQINQPA